VRPLPPPEGRQGDRPKILTADRPNFNSADHNFGEFTMFAGESNHGPAIAYYTY